MKEESKDQDTNVYFSFKTGVQDQLMALHYNDPVPLAFSLKINLLGNLELSKLNTNKDLVDGSVFTVNGPGYNGDVTVQNGKILLEKIKKGTYTIKEKSVGTGYLLNTESYKAEVKLKADVIKLFLEQQIKILGNKKIPKDFKFSFENAVEFIMSLDADKESKENVIQRLTDLYTNSYMKRVSGLTTEDDDGNKQENNEFEQTAFGNDVEKERNIDKLCYLIDILFKEMENNKLKQYARYYITMKIILKYKIFGNNNWAINYYIDKDLERFYYEKYSDYTDEKYIKIIIAEYVGKASDTVRKKIDAVKKIIQNNLLKVASKNN